MDCSLPGSSVHVISQKNTGVGCHFLSQGTFPTQGLNLHLLRWQAYLLLCHLGSLDLKMTKLETLTYFVSTLTTTALLYDTGGLIVSLMPFSQNEISKVGLLYLPGPCLQIQLTVDVKILCVSGGTSESTGKKNLNLPLQQLFT